VRPARNARDGWLRQPPAARTPALLVSVSLFLYVISVSFVPSACVD